MMDFPDSNRAVGDMYGDSAPEPEAPEKRHVRKSVRGKKKHKRGAKRLARR